MLRNICLAFMFCILSSVAFADATAILNEPAFADLKKVPGSEDILKRFRSYDELKATVHDLPFSEFAGRYAPNNYEAASRIYGQVSRQLYEQSRFNESIYDKRIEPQDPASR